MPVPTEDETYPAVLESCPVCREQVEDEWAYCAACGSPIDDVTGVGLIDRIPIFVRAQGRRMLRNPLAFFIRWGIYVFCFGLGVSIFRGCVQGAIQAVGGT